MTSPADDEACCQGQEQDGFCVSCRPVDAERGVSLQRLRLIIDNYQGTPYPLNRTSLREVFDELDRLRQQNAALREALEVMLESTQPDSTMRDVFDARDHAQAALA